MLRRFSKESLMSIRRAPAAALSLAFSLVAAVAAAQTAPDYVFDTIDSYRVSGGAIYIAGVLHGQSASTSIEVFVPSASMASCEHALIQAVNRPGRLTVSLYGTKSGPNTTCEVKRNP
jgi:hypothetical protein